MSQGPWFPGARNERRECLMLRSRRSACTWGSYLLSFLLSLLSINSFLCFINSCSLSHSHSYSHSYSYTHYCPYPYALPYFLSRILILLSPYPYLLIPYHLIITLNLILLSSYPFPYPLILLPSYPLTLLF